jgi:phosphoglycolate phosphatase-like HAD superfamily hydrolase
MRRTFCPPDADLAEQGDIDMAGGPAVRGRHNTIDSGLKGLVFDVDGVMFDSRRSNIEYYNLIRHAVQLAPISAEEEDFCHMASVDEALERIIPPRRREKARDAAGKINYTTRILPMLSLEPGLPEALFWLRQKGVRLAILTNRNNSVAELLRYFSLESFFSPVMTAGNSPPKPHPAGLMSIVEAWKVDARRIAFLGDSSVDEQAAGSAGVPFWAFRNKALNADLHVSDFFQMMQRVAPLVKDG